jgi:hypothetical protein
MAYLHRLQEHTFQMIWNKSEVILGTYWELGEHIANIMQNILWTTKFQPPPPTHLPQKKKKGIKVKCYWKHLGNLKNMLGIHWEHNGNTLWTIKIQKIQDLTPNFPQRLIWDKSEVWLGTSWKLNKRIGNSLGSWWEHIVNNNPRPPPSPNKTMWDRS